MAKDNNRLNILKRIPASTHEVLAQNGFAPELPLQKRKTITVSENAMCYSLDISGGRECVAYQIDGNIVTEGNKCDKLVLVHTGNDNARGELWTEVFVELKGRDVYHGLTQLVKTVKQQVFKHSSNTEVRARLVAVNFPANNANPGVEKLKIELSKLKVKYKQFKNGQKDSL